MLNHGIRDASHQSPPYPAVAPAAHHYQPSPYLLGHFDYLLLGSPFPQVGLLNSPPRLLYPLGLLLERLLGLASVFPEHIFEVGGVLEQLVEWVIRSHGEHVQL